MSALKKVGEKEDGVFLFCFGFFFLPVNVVVD